MHKESGMAMKALIAAANRLAIYQQKGWLGRCQAWLQDRLTDTAGAVLHPDEESGISEVASVAEGVQALHHAEKAVLVRPGVWGVDDNSPLLLVVSFRNA